MSFFVLVCLLFNTNHSNFLLSTVQVGDKIEFSVHQKRRIFNLDETNFSLDGSDGGRGGRPSASYTVSGFCRPGTASNKTSVASTLMCGSNAAGEPLPLHIMFSSAAQDETNYSVSAEWMFDLPRIYAQFGHDSPQSFCSTVTENS
jgi:hypothetical protein